MSNKVEKTDPMAGVLAMMNQLLENQNRQDTVIQKLAQQVNNTNPGNVTMSQPMTHKIDPPKPVKQVQMVSVSIEEFTDPRSPYIALLIPEVPGDKYAKDGLSRNYLEGDPRRESKIIAKVKTFQTNFGMIAETRVSGQFPVGSVFETRGGTGVSYYAVTENGTHALAGYDDAKQLVKGQ